MLNDLDKLTFIVSLGKQNIDALLHYQKLIVAILHDRYKTLKYCFRDEIIHIMGGMNELILYPLIIPT